MKKKKNTIWSIFGSAEDTPWGMRIIGSIFFLLLFLTIAASGFRYFDPKHDWLDAIYVTILTVSTLNNHSGNQVLTDATKLWSIFVIVFGIALVATLGAQIVGFIIEGRIRTVLGRRKMEKEIAAIRGHVIIAGFGRMGCLIAEELIKAGKQVIVIDNNPERTSLAESMGILYILGNAQDDEILTKAGLDHAQYLYATLPNDASNVFVTLTGRYHNPEVTIIARAEDPATNNKLKRAGADKVICPQLIGANHMVDVVIRPVMVDFVEMAHSGVDLEMDQIRVHTKSQMIGKNLAELAIPDNCGAQIVAIVHQNGETNYHPTRDLIIQPGDLLITVGKKNAAKSVHDLNVADAT